MPTKLLRALLFLASVHPVFAQDGMLHLSQWLNNCVFELTTHLAPLTQTTECGPDVGNGNSGGLLTCFVKPSTTAQQPQPTTPVGTVPTEGENIPGPVSTIPATVTVYPLTGTVTGHDGALSTVTTSVSWTSSDIAASTTVDGQTKETTIPVWVCIGELCNPKCKQSEPCDTSEDGAIGPSGFPWPLVSLPFLFVHLMYSLSNLT